jgi:hypothetical protein
VLVDTIEEVLEHAFEGRALTVRRRRSALDRKAAASAP